MKAKEYLQQLKLISEKMQTVDDEVKRLRAELKAIGNIDLHSSWPDGQPHGVVITDPTGNQAARIADSYSKRREELKQQLIQHEYDQLTFRSELWEKRAEILAVLQKVTNADYFKILVKRYVDYESFENIAVDICYSYQYTIIKHGEALAEVDRILNGKES